jgi:hypothetical protein
MMMKYLSGPVLEMWVRIPLDSWIYIRLLSCVGSGLATDRSFVPAYGEIQSGWLIRSERGQAGQSC